MKKYMINICYCEHTEIKKNGQGDGRHPEMMTKYREWSEKLGNRIVAAHKLKDNEGHTVQMIGGKPKDGPFVETKESIGGFYIVEAENYAEAIEMSKGCPTLRYGNGYVDVREVEI